MSRKLQFGFLLALTALATSVTCSAARVDQPPQAPATEHASQPVHRVPGAGLEARIKMFTQALDLDATQQGRLRRILLEQREAVRRIWSDRTLTPAERAPATKAANEATSEKIRGILNDQQKKKYNSAPAASQEPLNASTLEQWLQAHPQ